jgi:hypothetical protein
VVQVWVFNFLVPAFGLALLQGPLGPVHSPDRAWVQPGPLYSTEKKVKKQSQMRHKKMQIDHHKSPCLIKMIKQMIVEPSNSQGSNICAQTRVRQCSGSVLPSDSCHATEGLQLADTDAVTQVGSLFAGVHAEILPCSTATHNQRSTPVLPQRPRILIFLSVWYSFSGLNALPPNALGHPETTYTQSSQPSQDPEITEQQHDDRACACVHTTRGRITYIPG